MTNFMATTVGSSVLILALATASAVDTIEPITDIAVLDVGVLDEGNNTIQGSLVDVDTDTFLFEIPADLEAVTFDVQLIRETGETTVATSVDGDVFAFFESRTGNANELVSVVPLPLGVGLYEITLDHTPAASEQITDYLVTIELALVGGGPDDCTPVIDPEVRTQGFWKRVCRRPHPSGEHERLPEYVECFASTDTFAGVVDEIDLCDRLSPDPKNDKCEQAEAQFTALLLNLCSGRIAACNCIDDDALGMVTIQDAVDTIDELLSNPARTFDDCVLAQSIADGINNGATLVDWQ